MTHWAVVAIAEVAVGLVARVLLEVLFEIAAEAFAAEFSAASAAVDFWGLLFAGQAVPRSWP